MKATYMKYFMAAALAFVFCSCVEEKLETAYPEENIGVYFVEGQENAKSHTLDKDEDTPSLNFYVRRADTRNRERVQFTTEVYYVEKEALTDTSTVEVIKPVEKLFVFSELVFEEGEKESFINVRFDRAELGRVYNCNISITDPRFVSPYDYRASSISFSVQMIEWRKLPEKALFRDGFFSDLFKGSWKGNYLETEVEIWQRRDKPGYYRLHNVYDGEFLARLILGDEEYNKEADKYKKQYASYVDKDHYIYLDASDPEKVYFPMQYTGFADPSMGNAIIGSDVDEVVASGSNNLYGTNVDNVVTFPKNSLLFELGMYYGYSNISGKTRIVLPGGKAEDYYLDLESKEMTPEGKFPVTFTPAKDVSYIKYSIFKGKISEGEIPAFVDSVKVAKEGKYMKLTVEDAKNEQEIVIDDRFDTGIHTLVACTYDSADNLKEYNHTYLGYVKDGDNRDVKIWMGVHTDDYYHSDKEEENYDSTNSFQYWVRGENITHVQIAYYPTAHYKAYEDVIKKDMSTAASMGSIYLTMINKGAFSGIVGNTLKAGTSYTMIVYAKNGYKSGFFTEEVILKGKPDHAQKVWYYNDLLPEMQNIDAYTGTWIPVSIDINSAEAEERTIRGKKNDAGEFEPFRVTFRKEGEKMVVCGLFPSVPAKTENGPEIVFDIKDNKLVTTENKLQKVFVKDTTNIVPSLRFEYLYRPKLMSLSGNNNTVYEYYEDDDKGKLYDFVTAGFVEEDVIAFVDNNTEHYFWTMMLGGYQEYNGEDRFSDVIGEAHGDLILVKEDSDLLKELKESESSEDEEGMILNSISELNKRKLSDINSIVKGLKKSEITHEMIGFSVSDRIKVQQ